jgi:DNA primase
MHHVGAAAFKNYIENSRKDFILYKANILLKEAGTDPIKRAGIIKDIVESISKIPDDIKASIFIRECSSLLQIEERILLSELNKMRAAKFKKASNNNPAPSYNQPQDGPPDNLFENPDSSVQVVEKEETVDNDSIQEQEIVRLLLAFGHEFVNWDKIDNMYIGSFIMQNLSDVTFEDALCKRIIDTYREEIENGHLPVANQFIKSESRDIADLAITLSTSPYMLSDNWYNKHKIYVRDETVNLKATILGGIYHLKKRKVDRMLLQLLQEIKVEEDPVNQEILMARYSFIKGVEKEISKFLGSVILK